MPLGAFWVKSCYKHWMTTNPTSTPPSHAHTPASAEIWGHPKGLWVLFGTEGWLSFAQYGMLSILVLYLKDLLQHPERTQHVIGLRSLLVINQAFYNPNGVDATAGSLSGLIMAVIFAAPFLGSFIADRGLGRTRSGVIGITVLTLSFCLMAVESFFVIALWLFLIGVGFSGSLKAQVGALYKLDDRRRSDAYQIYSQSIQIMAIISPLLCAFLGTIAWYWAFLSTACAVIIGLLCYIMGRHYLPLDEQRNVSLLYMPIKSRCSKIEKQRIFFLMWLVVVFALGVLPNQEIMDGYLLWGGEHYQLTVLGITCPVGSLVSLDSVISMMTGFIVLWFWQWYDHRYGIVRDMMKIIIGSAITTLGPLFLICGEWLYPGAHQVSLWWGVAFHTVNDIGCGMTFPIGMALFSRYAPPQYNTTLISCFTLHIFIGNLLVGKLAAMLHQIPDSLFWLLHSGAALLSTLGLLASNRLSQRLFPTDSPKEQRL